MADAGSPPQPDYTAAAPWLAGVPQLSDELAALATCETLDRRTRVRIQAAVARLCRQVRQARLEWLATQAPPEMLAP